MPLGKISLGRLNFGVLSQETLVPILLRCEETMRKGLYILGPSLLVLLIFGDLLFGSVRIPGSEVLSILVGKGASKSTWETIILNYRLPRAFTAVLAGMALGGSGLLMQTLFRNPLAGPSLLGINSGASLGASLIFFTNIVPSSTTLFGGLSLSGYGMVAFASILGALFVLLLVVVIAKRVGSVTTLLLFGVMLGYGVNALVSVFIHFSAPEKVQAYINWTFGDYGSLTWSHLSFVAPVVLVGLFAMFFLTKPLNGLVLGESYATSIGLHLGTVRMLVITVTAVLAGTITAFCGPIAFIGLAAPHIARMVTKNGDHRILIPATLFAGGIVSVAADIISQAPGSIKVLPLNAVTALFGAPVVLILLMNQRKRGVM